MQWIKYLSTTEGVRIQHVRNSGEKEIGLYNVDGYYENENGQKYVLEFNGMFWHGYVHCYNASTVNPVNGMTMGDLYQLTMEKNRYPKPQGYIYLESGNASSTEKFGKTTLYETLSNNPR
jgi:hypothetical protein